jgi:hypothetical protein
VCVCVCVCVCVRGRGRNEIEKDIRCGGREERAHELYK